MEQEREDIRERDRPPSGWPQALVRIACAVVIGGVCIFGLFMFNPPVQFRSGARHSADLTYVLEKHKAVMNLELVRRTITGAVDQVFHKDYSIRIWGMGEPEYSLTAYAEIKCPVTYSYYVSLNDPWKITHKNGIVYVNAPQIRVGAPQIDTTALTERYEAPLVGFDKEKIMAGMRTRLTPVLRRIGKEQKHIAYVREDCRRQVRKFIRNWVMQETDVEAVIVRFADDKSEETEGIIERNEKNLEIRASLN